MAKIKNLEIPKLRHFVGNKTYDKIIKFANEITLPALQKKDVFTLPGITSRARYITPDPLKYIRTYSPDSISYSTYEKMTEDYQIHAGLCIIKLPIGQITWDIKCKDKEVRLFVKQEINKLLRGLVKNMLTAIEYGFAPHEKVWEVIAEYNLQDDKTDKITTKKNMVILKKIKLVKPDSITINRDQHQDYAGLTQEGVGTIPTEKTLLFSHDVQYGNLYGRPRIRGSYQPWYWSHLIIAFCNRFHERFSQPLMLGRAPVGTSQTGVDKDGKPIMESNIQLMQNVLESAQERTSITIPSSRKEEAGYDLEMLTSDTKGQQFLNYLRLLDAWKLRGMFIPETVLTQPYESGGSYGLARTHTSTFMKGEEDLVISIIDCINKQLIPQLVAYNYGKKAPKATMTFLAFSDELRKFLQKVYNNMILKGTAIAGADELASELGIPISTKKAIVPQELPVPDVPKGRGGGKPEEVVPKAKKEKEELKGHYYNNKELKDYELVVNFAEIDNWTDKAKQKFINITKSFRKKYANAILKDLQNVYTKKPKTIKNFFKKYKTPYLEEYQVALEKILRDLFKKGRKSVRQELEKRIEQKELQDDTPPDELIEDERVAMEELEASAVIIAMLDNDILNRKLFWDIWQYRLKGLAFVAIITILRQRILDEINKSLIRMIGYAVQQAFIFGRTFQAKFDEDFLTIAYYTAILDKSTCSSCEGLDGQEFVVGSSEYFANMPPHMDCEGGTRCRCMYIYK